MVNEGARTPDGAAGKGGPLAHITWLVLEGCEIYSTWIDGWVECIGCNAGVYISYACVCVMMCVSHAIFPCFARSSALPFAPLLFLLLTVRCAGCALCRLLVSCVLSALHCPLFLWLHLAIEIVYLCLFPGGVLWVSLLWVYFLICAVGDGDENVDGNGDVNGDGWTDG